MTLFFFLSESIMRLWIDSWIKNEWGCKIPKANFQNFKFTEYTDNI